MAALAAVGVKKARPASVTVNEVRLRSTETLIQNLPLERLVREAAQDLKPSSATALESGLPPCPKTSSWPDQGILKVEISLYH